MDCLTDYLRVYQSNQLGTFANKGTAMADLIKIDSLFDRLLKGAVNPRPPWPMLFTFRAHSAFRAAVGAVMAGQVFESQVLLRLCLEHAAYGFYIGSDADRTECWLRRGDGDAHRKVVRKEFHNDKIKAHIEATAPVMANQFDWLYNQTIEYGAHPNEAGYLLNSTIDKNENDDVKIDTIYLHADDLQLGMGLKNAGQAGLRALHLMQLLYPERYELLGIRSELEEVRTRF